MQNKYLKVFGAIFCLGFFLNIVWENLHAPLYTLYRGLPITEGILFRASLFDATFIIILALLFVLVPFFKKRLYIALIFGFVFAVCLELFALSNNRWGYTEAMPLLPYIKVGVSPALQLGVTAFLTYYLVLKKWSVTKITST